MNMEMRSSSKLNSQEQELYKKALSKNSNLSEDDFLEFRKMALGAQGTGVKKFFEVNGMLMQSENMPKGDELRELTEDRKAGG